MAEFKYQFKVINDQDKISEGEELYFRLNNIQLENEMKTIKQTEKRFYLDCEEYSKEGYKLETMIYMDNEMLIIYLNDRGDLKIKNLYIGDRVQI